MNVEGKVVARKRGAARKVGTNDNKEKKEKEKVPRSEACCARCRNHHLYNAVKDHKRYCRYRDCDCVKCQITAERQRAMARQTKMQRDLAQDERKVLAPGEVDPRERNIDTDLDSRISGHSGRVKVESSMNLVSDLVNNSMSPHPAMPQIRYKEIFLEYSMKLLHILGYPWVCLTFVYLIVKESGGNLDKAVRRIAEANSDIRAMDVWNTSEMKIQSDMSLSGTPLPHVDTVGAPTYVGQVPYIGVLPPPGEIHLGGYPQPMPVVPKVSPSPDTPSEHSTM